MLTVESNQRATMSELQHHSFITTGEVKSVLSDLSTDQIPEYQQIPQEFVRVIKK